MWHRTINKKATRFFCRACVLPKYLCRKTSVPMIW
ncbi:hypothetical protein PuT2_05690 [Pusillimonas sp. T2]|nr:hypothetical protein PuT2_05690 [Pusillimonas sp. T2]